MGRYTTPLPGQLSWKPFRVTDAARLGVGRGRMRSPDLIRPVRGVRAPSDADLLTRCRALLLHRPTGMWFSHLTAARLLGIPLPTRLAEDERVHVSVAAPARAPQITGVAGHVASRSCLVQRDGLPIPEPADVWIELAASLRREELVIAGDFLVASELATVEDLLQAADRARGRRGVSRAKRAIPLIRPGSESPGESTLRIVLQDAALEPPELNYRIHARDGAFVARVDMAYPDQRLVIEYEGDYHRVIRDQWHKDIRRQSRLEDLGWRVIRATAADLADPTALLARVRRALFTSGE
ncbi:endonuclease domain-containing protein [Leifsonia xyli]|uniref:endonuclease domain-containing protein n=1 Tax=Leifsonia xyli TaxID=1575 RepID=UPI003D67AEBF